jgi:superfamily II DNA or RNA helicase
MLRRHQAELNSLCEEIKLGRHTALRRIICPVVPGGGKSLLPLILAAHLLPHYADKLCWVVPRLALQHQAEREFIKPGFRQLLQHQHELRQSTNDVDPSRGLSGYITTYQAISQNPDLHAHEFARYRYVLVLDEPHHVEENGAWERALSPLVDKAALVVFMSGTLERGNGQRMVFLPYRLYQGVERLNLSSNEETAIVRYSRTQALAERALIPMFFRHFDAQAEWLDGAGQTRSTNSLNTAGNDAGPALITALSTHYALQVLDAAVQDWQAHRRQNPHAKLLVVAASVASAREYVHHLKRGGVSAEIATSLESELALQNIGRFRRVGAPDAVNALVTVQMAYEGLDVPSITHLACLTHIRSRPWIEQMLARATRYDPQGPRYEEQAAYVYVPDDPLLMQIINDLAQEQAPFIAGRIQNARDMDQRDDINQGQPVVAPRSRSIVPCGSAVTRQRASEVSQEMDLLSYTETERMQAMMTRHGVVGLSPLQLKRVLEEAGASLTTMPPRARAEHNDEAPMKGETGDNHNEVFVESQTGTSEECSEQNLLTASERERHLRQAIQKRCSSIDGIMNWERGSANRLVLQEFGKSRETMTLQELTEVWIWLQRTYRRSSPAVRDSRHVAV